MRKKKEYFQAQIKTLEQNMGRTENKLQKLQMPAQDQ